MKKPSTVYPELIKNAIDSNYIEISEEKGMSFNFSEIKVFRGIEREEEDSFIVQNEDFKSYAEIAIVDKIFPSGIDPFKYEDIDEYIEKNKKSATFYSCSFFKDVARLENYLNTSNLRKLAEGVLNCDDGAVKVNNTTTHVDCWIYRNVNLDEKFVVKE